MKLNILKDCQNLFCVCFFFVTSPLEDLSLLWRRHDCLWMTAIFISICLVLNIRVKYYLYVGGNWTEIELPRSICVQGVSYNVKLFIFTDLIIRNFLMLYFLTQKSIWPFMDVFNVTFNYQKFIFIFHACRNVSAF